MSDSPIQPDISADPGADQPRRGRKLAAPRLVDFTQPLPPPDLGPIVPRPHQPAPRINPEAIVPPEDNPLSGWRWMGVRMLSRDLWPREAATNPVMVYYSGKQAGRLTEDLVGLLPWAILLVLESVFVIWLAKSFSDIWAMGLFSFFCVPALAALVSAVMVAVHLRRTMHTLPLEELMLTRLKPVDVVQGLSVRPIAVQSASAFYYTLTHMGLTAWAAYHLYGGFDAHSLSYVAIVTPLKWYISGMAIETGGAYAMRAHLCLRSPLIASIRMIFDLLLVPIMLSFITGILVVFLFLLSRTGFGTVSFLLVGVVGAIILWGIGSLIVTLMRSLGAEAMDWCHHYPGEWWINTMDLTMETGSPTRTLFTPWKPVSGRRRGRFFTAPPEVVK